jgi:hypothetical protein
VLYTVIRFWTGQISLSCFVGKGGGWTVIKSVSFLELLFVTKLRNVKPRVYVIVLCIYEWQVLVYTVGQRFPVSRWPILSAIKPILKLHWWSNETASRHIKSLRWWPLVSMHTWTWWRMFFGDRVYSVDRLQTRSPDWTRQGSSPWCVLKLQVYSWHIKQAASGWEAALLDVLCGVTQFLNYTV